MSGDAPMATKKVSKATTPNLDELVKMYRSAVSNKHILQARLAEAAVLRHVNAEALAAEAAVFARTAGQAG
jgi:NADH:ubiquinone oxidoreductase subunit D